MRTDGHDGVTVGGVVGVGQLEKVFHKVFHFLLRKHLPHRDGCVSGQGECHAVVKLAGNALTLCLERVHHIGNQAMRLAAFKTCGHGLNGIAVAPQRRDVEAKGTKAFLHGLDNRRIGHRKLNGLGKEKALRCRRPAAQLGTIGLVEYADVCPMLVDEHQARAHLSHDVAAMVLIVMDAALRLLPHMRKGGVVGKGNRDIHRRIGWYCGRFVKCFPIRRHSIAR